MQAFEVYALAGVLSLGTLALLHGLVWRVQRERSSALFSAGYLMLMLIFLFDDRLQPVNGRPMVATAVVSAAGFVLLFLAAVDCSGVGERWAKALRVAACAIGLAVVALAGAQRLSQVAGFTLVALFLATQAGLSAWAMRREPRSGHGLVLLALLSFPVALAAALQGSIAPAALRYLLIVPLGVTGMTVLTTGLLRAQRRMQQAQAELGALNAELEERVAHRTEELQSMVEGLESFNRSISHDLRGPLGGIAGVARLASEALERGDAATAARLLPAITAQAESSAHLVTALLALARMDEATLAREPVALDAVVQEALEQVRLAEASAAAPQVQLLPLPTVAADAGLVRQVYVNLVGNAVKFTRGVPSPRVEIGAIESAGETVLYVRDNGVGFEAGKAQRLFQPFQRLHGRGYQGHGVGLSIVRRIVEHHGGRVWAESRPGEGAAFYFTLGQPAG